jgi:hypothetical protein
LEVSGLKAQGNRDAESLIRLRATRSAFIYGSRPLGDIATFLRVEGETCRDITLAANDLRRAQTVVQTADGATTDAVSVVGASATVAE